MKLSKIGLWLAIFSLSFMLAVGATVINLRQNNLKLIQLTADIAVADKAGDLEAIDNSLRAVREHTLYHMNTSLSKGPPLQLPYKYYRDVMAFYRHEVTTKLNNNDSLSLLKQASEACYDQVADAGINCVQTYVSEQSSAPGQVELKPFIDNLSAQVGSLSSQLDSASDENLRKLNKDLYKFRYVSPKWSPDTAGFSLALAVVTGVGMVITTMLRIRSRRRARE